MATSKRKTAKEPVANAAAEPSSDGRDSEIARRAYDRYQQRGCERSAVDHDRPLWRFVSSDSGTVRILTVPDLRDE